MWYAICKIAEWMNNWIDHWFVRYHTKLCFFFFLPQGEGAHIFFFFCPKGKGHTFFFFCPRGRLFPPRSRVFHGQIFAPDKNKVSAPNALTKIVKLILNQGCGVGRFFRIPTPDSDSSSFEKPTPAVLKNRLRLPTPTPAVLKNRLRLPTPTPAFLKNRLRLPTPTPAFLKTRLRLQQFWKNDSDSWLRLQLKTCDSTDSDSTTLAVTAVVAASYL